ncbi:MAG: hypothetical protein EOM59_16695 [Clostridia bacterium]|nr:hypothetical protein [Clostridia bacterium]
MSTSVKSIRVTCQGAATLPLDRIEEFQGNLKKLSKKNLEKLKKRIVEDGFNVPFFVWDHNGQYKALDGHQRIKALCSLREEGWDIPLLPVAFIEASDEQDARKKLLAISSQYGEFDASELSDWLDDIGGEVAETLRLVDGEMKSNIDPAISSMRGKHYNDEEAPEIEIKKLIYRIEAIIKLKKRKKCLDLFAGRGSLSYWYKRNFDQVITNDKQVFDDIEHNYNMDAIKFIKTELVNHLDFDFIDFDDEGCPSKEIQEFFKIIKHKKKDPFVIAITDGQGLNLKSMGKINFFKTYMIREDKTVQAETQDYYDFVEIFRGFIQSVAKENGFVANELSMHLKENGNVIYSTFLIKQC